MPALTRRKSTPPSQEREALRQLFRTDLFALARNVLYKDTAVPPSVTFHRPVCAWRQSTPYERNLYLLPRDHYKTSLLTLAGNVQRILRDSSVRILLASNKAEAAEAQLAEIKGHLTHPLLLWLYPEILHEDPDRQAEEWTKSTITVKRKRRTKEGTIETIGVSGAVTGKHYDHGGFDDLVDEQNSKTRALLEDTIYWYQTTQSLFEPGATQDVVGTPWAFGDLYDWMIEQKVKHRAKFGVYRQPCWVVQEPGVLRVDARGGIAEDQYVRTPSGALQPAFPERFTVEELEDRKRPDRVGPVKFAAQYLLRPTDDESASFPRGKAVIRSRRQTPDPSTLWCVMAVDPAISTKEWADYSAIVVVGFAADGTAYVLDLRRGRWSESELVDQVYAAFRQTPNITAIGFEAVGFQKLYFNEFRRAGETRGFLPLIKLERDTAVTKAVRIRSIEPLWSAGQLVLVDDVPALVDFLEEAERFRPWRESLHDDMLDALADCLQLRVRPEPQNPDAGFDDEEAERRRFDREHANMDRASRRNAWQMAQRRQAFQDAREAEALDGGPLAEFWS